MVQPLLGLVTSPPLGTQGRKGGKQWPVLERARWGASVRPPCLPFLLCYTRALPRVLGYRTPEAAWKVFVGASVPIGFELVYSLLPGALVNGVYGASLFFVHPFQCDCCACHSGSTCACLATWGCIITACVFSQLGETGIFSLPHDMRGAR